MFFFLSFFNDVDDDDVDDVDDVNPLRSAQIHRGEAEVDLSRPKWISVSNSPREARTPLGVLISTEAKTRWI